MSDELLEAIVGLAIVVFLIALVLGFAGFILWALIRIVRLAWTGT